MTLSVWIFKQNKIVINFHGNVYKIASDEKDGLQMLNLYTKRVKAKYAALFYQLTYIISSHPTHDVHYQM